MNNTTPSFKSLTLKNTVIFNPVLVQLIGICPIVGASTSMFSSVLLTVLLTAVLCLTSLIASAALKKVSRWVRVALYLIIGAAIICPVQFALEALQVNLELSTRIFLPLLAISSLTAVHCEQVSVKNPVKASLADSFALSIGYGIVFLITGFFRELLGKGTVFGIETIMPVNFSGMLLPFGGLIVLAYLAVALRAYVNKFHPQFADESLIKIKRESLKIREEEQKPSAEEVQAIPEPVHENEEPQQIELFNEFWEEERPVPKPKKKITIEKPSLSAPEKREDYVAAPVAPPAEETQPEEPVATQAEATEPQSSAPSEAPVQAAETEKEAAPTTSASDDYFSSISQGFDDLIRSIETDTFTAKNTNNKQDNGEE